MSCAMPRGGRHSTPHGFVRWFVHMRSAICLAAILATTTARAEAPRKPHKSLATALGWSLGVTVGGVAVGAAGMAASGSPGPRFASLGTASLSLLIGPSIGRFYTGHYITAGNVTRVVGFGVAEMAQMMTCMSAATPGGQRPGTTCDPIAKLNGGFYLGAAIMGLGALWDLASIPEDVADFNAHITVVPTALRTPNGNVPGLALAGQF
jgi:hypothetical protein